MPTQVMPNTLVGDTLHQWTIKEYEEHAREKRWYIIMSVFGAALVLFGLFSGNFLFALIMSFIMVVLM